MEKFIIPIGIFIILLTNLISLYLCIGLTIGSLGQKLDWWNK
jgi:hypothetical protein